jgi:type I restriction enzyme S subunit
MAGEWEEISVAELQAAGALLVEDGNHGENRPRPDEFSAEGIHFIRAADMDSGRVLFERAQRINEIANQRVRKGIGAGGDVLLSHKGTVGKVAYVPLNAPPFVCSPQTTFWRVKDPQQLHRRYIYFYLLSRAFREQLDSRKGETDMADYVSLTTQRTLKVTVPPLAEQEAIASVLGALDDKIELNRRMNGTLEAMARALFQSWFVDFDPVRAKLDGRKPLGLDDETAALFTDSFQDSPLGHIPTGWAAIPLYDTAQWVNGAAFKNEDFCDAGEGLPVIKIGELKAGISDQTKWSQRGAAPDKIIETGDLVYSWSGSPDTSLEAFLWSGVRGLLNQHIFKVISATEAEKRFVYYLLQYLRPVLVQTARNKQTTGLGHVTIADMKRLFVCMPSKAVLAAFDRNVAPIFDKAFTNTLESRTLATLRDTLLPKLLSGALSVNAALESAS